MFIGVYTEFHGGVMFIGVYTEFHGGVMFIGLVRIHRISWRCVNYLCCYIMFMNPVRMYVYTEFHA